MRFQKVLIDGGSALNILFTGSLAELMLIKEDLTPVDSPLWGIILKKAPQPLRQITLSVQFSTTEHFCIDYVNFLVVDFNTAYHDILGRPALAKFMAVPHYTYLVLKMPMEQGILSLRTNLSIAYACEKDSFRIAEATDISIRMQDCLATS